MKRCLAFLLIVLLLLTPAAYAAEEDPEEPEASASQESREEASEDPGEGETSAEAVTETETGGEALSEEAAEEVPGEPAEETGPVYAEGQFSDVEESRWYGTEGQGVIRRVWELGLMVGRADGTFAPQDPLRLSEAVKLAALLHSRAVEDGAEFSPSTPWYQTYVDYAEETGILQPGEFADYTAFATRGETAHILAAALPEEQLVHINSIFAVPDVFSSLTPQVPYSEDIFRLYRAGVLLGDGGSHAFRPEDGITRAETAAAAVRLADPEQRQRLELLPLSGASSPVDSALLRRETGEGLSLGYHSWEEFIVFVGTDRAFEAADFHRSMDMDESEGYPVFGEEGSLIRAEYPAFTLEYLVSDRDPQGIYMLRMECTGEGLEDGRGIRVGMTLNDLLKAVPELSKVSDTDPVCFSCALADTGIEYLCTLGWDGRVSGFSLCLLQTGDGI